MPEDIYQINRSAYDRVAKQFAAANSSVPEYIQPVGQRMLERAGSAPLGSRRLLDIGCGPGRDLAWLSTQGHTALFGSDLSTGMLREARSAGVPAAFAQSDMRWLPYAAGSFACLWSNAALLHIPRAEAPRVLAEMARLLVPGGWLFLSVQKGSGEGLERSPYDPPVERYFTRYEPEEMASMLAVAGFCVMNQGENMGHRSWLWFEAQKV